MTSMYTNPRAQACQNCVKAKAKCYGHKDGQCERCHRLNKHCALQIPVVRKRKYKKESKHTVAAAQLDDVVSLLGTSQSPLTPGSLPGSVTTSDSVSTPFTYTVLPTFEPASQTQAETTVIVQRVIPRVNHRTSNISSSPDELLNRFRQNLARLVPFILISPNLNAKDLALERPFLYQAIITVTAYDDSVHQLVLGQQFVRDITEQLVVQGRKCLDILQGLLVYISWYNGLFYAQSQLNTLLGLAFSIIIDLNLYLPMPFFENHEKFLQEMKGIIGCGYRQPTWFRQAEPTRDERRTILGAFIVFSTTSTNFCRINPLRWTPYIQQCYDDILQDPDHENDVFLAHLSELHRISEEIRLNGIRGFASQPRTWNSAVGVNFKLLLSELEKFRACLPEELREDSLMLLYYHAVELYLSEICFSMPATDLTQTPGLRRADVLLKCVETTQAFFETYFSMTKSPYFIFFTGCKGHLYFAMTTLSSLLLFKAEDWNPKDVPPSIHLLTIVEYLAKILEDGSRQYDRKEDNKPWLIVCQKMRQVGVHFERLLASENRLLKPVPMYTQGPSHDFNQFDLLDDGFWQSLQIDTLYGQ